MSAAVLAVSDKPVYVQRAVLVALLALAGIALAIGLFLPGDDSAVDTSSNRVAPAFSLPDLNDPSRTVTLPKGTPTVLYFFASWCVPCRKEIPIVRDVAAQRPDVAFVGIDHLDHIDDGRAFLARFDADLPAGHDPAGTVAVDYQLRGLPATVFIGADGRIVSTLHGELDREILLDRLDDLVSR